MKAAAIFKSLVVLGALGVSLYYLYPQVESYIAPCARPVTYAVASLDPRFGISDEQAEAFLAESAALWNETAGKTLVVSADTPDVLVHFIYGERQKTAELGKVIDAEQAAYDAKKEEIDDLRAALSSAKRAYEREAGAFKADNDAYAADVRYWNRQGGAPPDEYARLTKEGQDLERRQAALNIAADDLNASVVAINAKVKELNALAAKVNQKADTYNESAGEDFDQGEYVRDTSGRRINIYEFTSVDDLKRVLAHEFGHALGLGHVEDPEAIMYSYNLGTDVALTADDISELTRTCRLDS